MKKYLFVLILSFICIAFGYSQKNGNKGKKGKKAKIEGIELSSVCTQNPEEYRRWRVKNPNHFEVEVTYKLIPHGETGTIVLPRASHGHHKCEGDESGKNYTFFTTHTVQGANTLKIYYGKNQQLVEHSEGKKCKLEGIRLASVCSNNPDEYRRWRIKNKNPFPVKIKYKVIPHGESDTLTLPPAGMGQPKREGDTIYNFTFLNTQTVQGANTLKIFYGKGQQLVKESKKKECDKDSLKTIKLIKEYTTPPSDDLFTIKTIKILQNRKYEELKVKFDIDTVNSIISKSNLSFHALFLHGESPTESIYFFNEEFNLLNKFEINNKVKAKFSSSENTLIVYYNDGRKVLLFNSTNGELIKEININNLNFNKQGFLINIDFFEEKNILLLNIGNDLVLVNDENEIFYNNESNWIYKSYNIDNLFFLKTLNMSLSVQRNQSIYELEILSAFSKIIEDKIFGVSDITVYNRNLILFKDGIYYEYSIK